MLTANAEKSFHKTPNVMTTMTAVLPRFTENNTEFWKCIESFRKHMPNYARPLRQSISKGSSASAIAASINIPF